MQPFRCPHDDEPECAECDARDALEPAPPWDPVLRDRLADLIATHILTNPFEATFEEEQ